MCPYVRLYMPRHYPYPINDIFDSSFNSVTSYKI